MRCLWLGVMACSWPLALCLFYIKQLKNNWFDIKQLTAIDDLFHDSTTQRTIRVGVTRALAFHFPFIRDARRVSLFVPVWWRGAHTIVHIRQPQTTVDNVNQIFTDDIRTVCVDLRLSLQNTVTSLARWERPFIPSGITTYAYGKNAITF